MRRQIAELTRFLLLAGMAAAPACFADLSDDAKKPGQPILFSSPDHDTISSNIPTLSAKPPPPANLADVVKSPIFHLDAGLPVAPPPDVQQHRVSPEESKRMKRKHDEQENWSLLTPEEILGLPTQEEIMGVHDHDAAGQTKEESVVLQYYERQQRLRSRTNNYDSNHDYGYDYGPTNGSSQWSVSGNRETPMDSNRWPSTGTRQERPTLLSQLLARAPSDRGDSSSDQDDGGSRPFNLPAQPRGPTPEQKHAMEQFQQLLNPHAPPADAARDSVFGSPLFPAPPTASKPSPQPLVATPIGASYSPLSTGLTMPAGLVPLSGLQGANNSSLPTLAPAWTPAPPPWMSTAPQLGVMPPRKF